jgi:HEAT repeat protein
VKRLVIITLLLALGGCRQAPPAMAGGKWAEALHSPDVRVRRKAAFTLGNIGPSDPAVLPALMGALADPDAAVRREAILALLKYGPGAQEAVPTLVEMRQHDRDAQVRADAARALQRLRGDARATDTSR